MLLSIRIIEDGLLRLRNLSRHYTTRSSAENMVVAVSKFNIIVDDVLPAYEDLTFNFESTNYSEYKQDIVRHVDRYRNNAIDIHEACERLIEVLDQTITSFPSHYTVSRYAYSKRDYFSSYKLRFLGSLSFLSMFTSDRTINVLDIMPEYCKRSNRSMYTSEVCKYAMFKDTNISSDIRSEYDRYGYGSFTGGRVANEAFDIVTIMPNLNHETNGDIRFHEKAMIDNIYKFIRPDGYMVLFLPYYRMSKDLANLICKTFDSVDISRTTGEDWRDGGVAVIIAHKKRQYNREVNPQVYAKLMTMHNKDSVQYLDDFISDHPKYEITGERPEVDMFRGSLMSDDEIKEFSTDSGLFDSFWKQQDIDLISKSMVRPHLPFNIGQIGLILTSGCLDGLVDEANGHFHVVKGRVIKVTSTEDDYNESNSNVIRTEIESNKVEINAFLPNGEFRVLA